GAFGPSPNGDGTGRPAPARPAQTQATASAPVSAPLPPPAPEPAEVAGLAPWREMFSLILSPDATDVDFGVSALVTGGTGGLARLMTGGAGPVPRPAPSTLTETMRL